HKRASCGGATLSKPGPRCNHFSKTLHAIAARPTAVIYSLGSEEYFALSRSFAATGPSDHSPRTRRHHDRARIPQGFWRLAPSGADGRGPRPASLAGLRFFFHR